MTLNRLRPKTVIMFYASQIPVTVTQTNFKEITFNKSNLFMLSKMATKIIAFRRTVSRKKATGFAAVHQLFTERWPTTPANRSVTGTTTERNIDFELDVRVEIDCGKCVLHPTTLQQEHDDIGLRR